MKIPETSVPDCSIEYTKFKSGIHKVGPTETLRFAMYDFNMHYTPKASFVLKLKIREFILFRDKSIKPNL